jgi:hypothetical protein
MEMRKAGKKYMTDVICDKDNTNKLWSYIKSKGQEFIGVAPLKNQQGFLKSDNQSKANILKASCCAADLSINAGTSSGPVALCGFWFFNSL